ncbi:MAG: thioredoxin family protein [Pyrinomonadaceae bacterium]|nr:thioredoxin family protein [Pyrinomonadaceae bacterium]MCX7639206.1 thioredoxin family protein [Pyrinomonadaceae bacterium]MDW8303572.1 thioredoxin family protein [Acidobacteriota bacterium]
MKKRVSVLLVTVAFIAVSTLNAAKTEGLAIGSILQDFKLKDINGVEQSFKSLKGQNGTVIIFLSAQCPVVKQYNDRINQIYDEYKTKGINFIGINSNSTESLEWVKSHAEENYKFPMLIDTGNILADEFSATVTPEIFLFDSQGKLVYRGAIDNDRSGKNVTENFLRDALNALLEGKQITKTVTKAFGCTIKRIENGQKPVNTSIIIQKAKI